MPRDDVKGGSFRKAPTLCVFFGAAFGSGTFGHADTPGAVAAQDRFWILWERIKFAGSPCPGRAQCQERRSFSSRPLATSNAGYIYRLFGVRDGGDRAGALPRDHPEAPVTCQKNRAAISLGFDPRALPRSQKGEVLRGVRRVHLDVTTLKPPPVFAPLGADRRRV